MQNNSQEVLTLDAALDKMKAKLNSVFQVTQTKVLPGPRGKLTVALTEVNALLIGVKTLAERTGIGQRYGFSVRNDGEVQIVSQDEKQDDPPAI